MHNLAIVLQKKGWSVSGSDDEIFEPARSRLEKYGLLPSATGWNPGLIDKNIDLVILGMHASADNPELARAKELELRIVSFPEFLYNETKNKKRIVVAGSHGKTTTTAMIMHVMKFIGMKFDYMVGSVVDGFETMVGLSDDSEIAVFEGDEYLTSPTDRRPKFHHYKPDIAVINGIAWDHMNVFPTFDNYCEQFSIFTTHIQQGGSLIYYSGDAETVKIAENCPPEIRKIPYGIHGHFVNAAGFFAATINRTVPLKIFGEHNMQNLSAAREACIEAGISEDDFYKAIVSFRSSSKRLQLIAENENGSVYLDFAHAPSKVKATIDAVRARFLNRRIIACLEIHTYSSLNIDFQAQYAGTMSNSDLRVVYYNPHALQLKKLPPLTSEAIKKSFTDKELQVFDNSEAMLSFLNKQKGPDSVYLFMSSGDFNGTKNELFGELIN